MHSLLKALIGVVIAIIGVYITFYGIPGIIGSLKQQVITVILGAIPIVLVIFGIFIAWLYYDEWKIEKELEEEKKEEKKKKK
jgi:phosphotransferase system  glucose/maltose/N-acetylglucosamine-specific IIC component